MKTKARFYKDSLFHCYIMLTDEQIIVVYRTYLAIWNKNEDAGFDEKAQSVLSNNSIASEEEFRTALKSFRDSISDEVLFPVDFNSLSEIQIEDDRIMIIVSPVTIWDEWEQLFLTKVGETGGKMPLLYIACGTSEKQSRERAERLLDFLTTQKTKNEKDSNN